MSKIIKGTTPTILLDFSVFELDVYDITKISMILKHGEKEWDVSDRIDFNRGEKQATLHFSQEQTFALSAQHTIYVQVDVLMSDGEVYRVAEGEYKVERTLRKEVLKNE